MMFKITLIAILLLIVILFVFKDGGITVVSKPDPDIVSLQKFGGDAQEGWIRHLI